MLASLAYVSLSKIPGFSPEMLDLVRVCLARNPALGLTGALYFDGTQFYQVLEGPAAALEAMYATIAADPRHCAVQRLWDGPIAQRRFGDWAMKFVDGSCRGACRAGAFDYAAALTSGRDQETRIAELARA
ncbi:MAG: BLUF domain-containing protein [Alkalilacustris sp.]